MTQINISNKHTNLARPSDHRGPPARPSCAGKRPYFKARPSGRLFHLRPKIICLISAAIIIPLVVNSLFDSQILLAPTNGLVSIPFALLSLLTSIIATAILKTDTNFQPDRRGPSMLEALILVVWPLAPATYFVSLVDAGSSRLGDVLATTIILHECMTALMCIAMFAYRYLEAAFREALMKAARKAAREVALEAAEIISADAFPLHTNTAPDDEKFFD
ncbi:hypothetical protein GQ607_007283 [Colletotrichum asianum]|uniref:Uncharacterized protein n=1 Tax=Colletotrichum asianum TaxID=702518 RepID=A0A8H3WJ47_9PEZI|nr:hypothetical protein GQ607_007283 [Colletotrichum asianum]